MDGRVSDFDDIFILFMKMEKKSCSRLGSKHQQNYFGGRSLYVSLNKYKHCWDSIFFMTQHVVVLLIMDMESAKSDVNGAKKILCFWQLWIKKWQKPKNYVSKSYRPNLYCIRLEVLYYLKKKKKKCLDWVNPDLISKSSLLTLDSSGRLIVQYTLHTRPFQQGLF